MLRKESNAWHRYRQLLPILRQNHSLRHRFRILQSCILQAILWGSETWVITKKRMTHLRGIHTRMLKGMIKAPGQLQGLSDSERILEYTRHVRNLLKTQGFLLLDQLWAKRVWNWAGHLARLDPSFPAHMWTRYHDTHWWRQQQKDPKGRRHQQWDANTTKWEDPLIFYSRLGETWKETAQNRTTWQNLFSTFWANLQVTHKHRKRPMPPGRKHTLYMSTAAGTLEAFVVDPANPEDNTPTAPADSSSQAPESQAGRTRRQKRARTPQSPPNRRPQKQARQGTGSRQDTRAGHRNTTPTYTTNYKILGAIGEDEPLINLLQANRRDHAHPKLQRHQQHSQQQTRQQQQRRRDSSGSRSTTSGACRQSSDEHGIGRLVAAVPAAPAAAAATATSDRPAGAAAASRAASQAASRTAATAARAAGSVSDTSGAPSQRTAAAAAAARADAGTTEAQISHHQARR